MFVLNKQYDDPLILLITQQYLIKYIEYMICQLIKFEQYDPHKT